MSAGVTNVPNPSDLIERAIEGGGWALAVVIIAVLIFANIAQYRRNNEVQEKRVAENSQVIQAVGKMADAAEAMTRATEAMQSRRRTGG